MNSYEKGSPEYEMMGDYFRLLKKYWDITQIDWVKLVDETDAFVNRYEKATKGFSRRLGMEFLNQLEDMYKGVHECG